jgi:hypothetical protein
MLELRLVIPDEFNPFAEKRLRLETKPAGKGKT